ncbi:MAG: ATP-binding cassette domain-containing protein, partial [Gammaproteobacteria bacterium]|nr:ATP-binding cassette domain-containing protein [Gammaproteobacteria bacterium]
MNESVIQVQGLTKCYGELCAVDNVSFEVAAGSVCGLLGGNGAGKTTTLSMLLGLLLPTSGAIRVLGEDMLKHRYRVLGRMNFSSPYVDLPHRLSVSENLGVYARLYGIANRAARIRRLAEDLDIAAFLN